MLETELIRYGYLFVFLGTIVEGDATLLTAAFLAHRGYLNLSTVMIVAGISTWMAAQTYFLIARRGGLGWLASYSARSASNQRRIGKLVDWAERHGGRLLFASRFLFGLRTIIPVICGATGMAPGRFVAWNTVGAVVWCIAFGWAGYLGGHVGAIVLADIRRHEKLLAIVGGLLIAGLIVWRTHGRELADIWQLRKIVWRGR